MVTGRIIYFCHNIYTHIYIFLVVYTDKRKQDGYTTRCLQHFSSSKLAGSPQTPGALVMEAWEDRLNHKPMANNCSAFSPVTLIWWSTKSKASGVKQSALKTKYASHQPIIPSVASNSQIKVIDLDWINILLSRVNMKVTSTLTTVYYFSMKKSQVIARHPTFVFNESPSQVALRLEQMTSWQLWMERLH